jgi:hypothetical protein
MPTAPPLKRFSHAHGDVVEKAEAHGGRALSVVAGRAHAAEGGGRVARQHQVGGLHCRAGRAQGSGQRVRAHVGVGVHRVQAFGRRGLEDLAHVERGVGAAELLFGGQRRVVGNHVVEQALDQQVVVDGAQALGAFRVVRAHVVAGAVGVGDVGGQHVFVVSSGGDERPGDFAPVPIDLHQSRPEC